jgi:sec-independent protein translocase protein TatB
MFGMSMTEIVIIVIFALLVLGPGELPAAARTIGKTLRDVRRAGDDLRDTFEREIMQEKPLQIRPVAEAVAKGSTPPPAPSIEAANASPPAETPAPDGAAAAATSSPAPSAGDVPKV